MSQLRLGRSAAPRCGIHVQAAHHRGVAAISACFSTRTKSAPTAAPLGALRLDLRRELHYKERRSQGRLGGHGQVGCERVHAGLAAQVWLQRRT